jgi:hypothetical protein
MLDQLDYGMAALPPKAQTDTLPKGDACHDCARRFDCVLEATKAKVLEEQKRLKGQNATIIDKMFRRAPA